MSAIVSILLQLRLCVSNCGAILAQITPADTWKSRYSLLQLECGENALVKLSFDGESDVVTSRSHFGPAIDEVQTYSILMIFVESSIVVL